MISDLSRIFGDLRRWSLAVVLASVAYGIHAALVDDQAVSLALAWACIKRSVGLIAVLMVFFAIQRRHAGHYRLDATPIHDRQS